MLISLTLLCFAYLPVPFYLKITKAWQPPLVSEQLKFLFKVLHTFCRDTYMQLEVPWWSSLGHNGFSLSHRWWCCQYLLRSLIPTDLLYGYLLIESIQVRHGPSWLRIINLEKDKARKQTTMTLLTALGFHRLTFMKAVDGKALQQAGGREKKCQIPADAYHMIGAMSAKCIFCAQIA